MFCGLNGNLAQNTQMSVHANTHVSSDSSTILLIDPGRDKQCQVMDLKGVPWGEPPFHCCIAGNVIIKNVHVRSGYMRHSWAQV